MEKITGNEPISGWPSTLDQNGDGFGNGNPGMTLRQYYAGLAMQGMLANGSVFMGDDPIQLSEKSLACADALITQLNQAQ